MSKRKRPTHEEASKRQKPASDTAPCDPTIITKQSRFQKENIPWPHSDILQLISKIEGNIPSNDNISYLCRMEKLNWENIAFKDHSPKECQEVWVQLHKHVRKYRLLGEIVADLKVLVNVPKPKVLRHPEKPKQPKNSYMLFTEEKRQEVMTQNPHLSPNDMARKMGELFRNLPMKDRERYEQKAKVARQDYLEKLQAFYEEHPNMIPKKRDRRSKSLLVEEEEGRPEKPKTPFELFLKAESEKEETDVSRYVVIQKCRDRWNELSDKQKLFWINCAEEEYIKYLEDLKEYIKIHPDYEPGKPRTIISKKEKEIKERCAGKPAKPPRAPYHLFCKLILETEEVRKINSREVMSFVAEKWKTCPEEEKNEYKIRVEQMWEEYEEKLEAYLRTLPPERRDRIREEESRKKPTPCKTEIKAVKSEEEPKVKLDKPKMPPPTEYKYFLSVYKGKKNPAAVWKAMSDEEKSTYEEKLMEERRKYIVLYEQYLKSLSREELEKVGESLADEYSSSCNSLTDESEVESEC